MRRFTTILNRLQRDERGASAVEYAILVGIIGAALATGAQTFGNGLGNTFSGLLATAHLTSSSSSSSNPS